MQKFFILAIAMLGTVCSLQAQIALEQLSPPDTFVAKTVSPAVVAKAIPEQKIKGLYVNDIATLEQNGPALNPRAVSFVADYMDKHTRDLNKLKDWGLPYFNMMDAVLVEHHLPRELKYLAVIESELKSSSISWAGAVGPWQLMPVTARQLGLKVNKNVDERRNYVKSTHAASKYLNDLYRQFGDWLLVIAAYNGGPGAVLRAIKKSGSRNFWDLQYYLPAESRNHVKKFIGTHYVLEGQGGLTTLTKAETAKHYGDNIYAFTRALSNEELSSAITQTISGKYRADVIARNINMEYTDFLRYNPQFDKVMSTSANGYEMKLPAEKMDLFIANKYQILNESVKEILSSTITDNNSAKSALTTR